MLIFAYFCILFLPKLLLTTNYYFINCLNFTPLQFLNTTLMKKLMGCTLMILWSFTIWAQDTKNVTESVIVNGQKVNHYPRNNVPFKNGDCNTNEYRNINGTCNNLSSLEWGAADIMLRRQIAPQYDDALNTPNGIDRLSPRAISNIVFAQDSTTEQDEKLSAFVYSWGQFLDHDISLTPEGEAEVIAIPLPEDEPLFSMPIMFHRSEIAEGTGVDSPREQRNLITSWIDASNVYGSDSIRANWLRTFNDGQLKMSDGNLLPYNTIDGQLSGEIDVTAPSMAGDSEGTSKVFVAGDVRANEQPGLISLHTLFAREHNSICDELIAQGLSDDELIYQEARKRVGALIQTITFNEFLPALGIQLTSYTGYDETVEPSISNLFATAAYRIGHTMVAPEIVLLDDDCNGVAGGTLPLFGGFFNPSLIQGIGIDAVLKGYATQFQEKIDHKVIDELRNLLFGDPTNPPVFGLDLASLNIQRGRDHGLVDYNSVRAAYLGSPVTSFEDINSNPEVSSALETAFEGNIDNIDLWVGLLAEEASAESPLGVTTLAILTDQFARLRDGDRFYFENDSLLTPSEIAGIQNTLLSDIILRNTQSTMIQANVFEAVPCDNVSAISLKARLQGASISSDIMMRSDLMEVDMIPKSEPYEEMTVFESMPNDGKETMKEALKFNENEKAVVDWVMIELRDANDPSIVHVTKSVLLSCDGQLMDSHGKTDIRFYGLTEESYYVAIRHRNHLGAMTAEAVEITNNSITHLDFTDPLMETWGNHAQIVMPDGTMALWAGDCVKDGRLVYQGLDNDVNEPFFYILNDANNVDFYPNYISSGYVSSDLNLNGKIIHQGLDNDPNILFFNILSHPANTDFLINFVIYEQLP